MNQVIYIDGQPFGGGPSFGKMNQVIYIDGQPFDPSIEHFSFPLYHKIQRMEELQKLPLFLNLKSANFCDTNLDDIGLQYVSRVATLENLDLQDTKISNDGLAHLARLPRLAYLRLKEKNQLTNQCVPFLVRLESLTELQIHETAIDHQGLEAITGMKNLRNICVDVRNNNYTFDNLLALSARMPDCTILAKGHGNFFQGQFNGTWTMTEQEWEECGDPSRMLDRAGTKITERKAWLLAASCCVRIPHHMPTDQNAIEVVKKFIDREVGEHDLRAATAECGDHAVISLCEEVLDAVEFEAKDRAIAVIVRATDMRWYEASLDPTLNADTVRLAERTEQCRLVRHILGNPFRPYSVPNHWPANVIHLADAMYNGQDCGFALHDALLEAGHHDLAIHFRREYFHPKGCWALDVILGKS
jgi:hypothetical protein